MATIVMESSKVIEACEKVIARIEKHREDKDEKTIATRMQYKHGWIWARKNYTREEAIDFLNEQTWLDSWGWCYAYGGQLQAAKKLLKLAQHGDPVTLNQDDIENIF